MHPFPNNDSLWESDPILFHSVINDHYDVFVKKLFDYSSLINTPNIYGETLLHYCCFYGIIDKYYALINIGAIAKNTKNGNNLLHYASYSGKDNFLIVELVKAGICPIQKNHQGKTSLHYSADEKISHYLNLWCLRNNIAIPSLLDEDNNTVAHGCKIAGHHYSAQYWINHYPVLNESINIYGKKWQDTRKKQLQFCPY